MSPGIATVIMHKKKASSLFKVVGMKEDDDAIEIENVGKKITSELSDIPTIKEHYPVLDSDELSGLCLPTLTALLTMISPNFKNNSKAIALISSMIITIARSKVTTLQVALGLLLQEKKLIEHLYEYGVTASYDEVRRFKISAAYSASQEKEQTLDSTVGLIQGISDNFDANLSTQNGLKQTHSLATIVTQHLQSPNEVKRDSIPRLKKDELASVPLKDVDVKIYSGEKKPQMPKFFALCGVLPLRVLCEQSMITSMSKEKDFQFIRESLTVPNTPDYGGYNTRQARATGQSKKLKTRILYRPMINKTPSDPSTMLTAMCEVEATSKKSGQSVSVFTCDQQLYRVALDIIWANPGRWSSFYPRIGGMHWLMNFAGCVGKLMSNSGLENLMKTAFGGVDRMLQGKKFPMNIRALRIVSLELLRGFIDEQHSYESFVAFLNELSERSRLAEHWIKNLINPVLLMMLYTRAEREGEFALHLYACREMLPYFFAAGHWNYARDGVAYLRMMEKLPTSLLDPFMKGQHVIRLQDGRWNGIWTDMSIESTYMKIGKGPSGLIGITTNERSVKIWANGHHL